MPIKCSACGQEWPRDPALEVVCPVCRAAVGAPCQRPSGHRVFGGEPHPDRDRLAMQTVPGYGRCPAAIPKETPPPGWVQPALFEEPGCAHQPGSEKEPHATCFVCSRPVAEAEAHRCHETDCADPSECDCSLLCHARCCPLCAAARADRLRLAFSTRDAPLPPAESPHLTSVERKP
jgi:hypothetical protein